MTNKINGIDASECPLYDKNTGCYHTFNGECVKDSCAVYKWLLEYKRLQEKNEKIKKQYNCYACGNCRGKEDYINLEKHHKGLRKQFDEYVKRNNALSLRIEELEKENKELKQEKYEIEEKFLNLNCKSYSYYKALEKIIEIINEPKPTLDNAISQSEFTLERLCNYEEKYIKVVDKINEVLK